MSFSQQAGQAPQDAAATHTSTNTQFQGNESASAFYEGDFEAAPATGGYANDSGFFEDEDEITPGTNYRDFTLFPDGRSEIDVNTYQLFAELDAATREPVGSFDDDSSNDSGVEFDNHTPASQLSILSENILFSEAVDEAIIEMVNQAVFEVIKKDYDAPSIPEFDPPPSSVPTSDALTDPFCSWLGTYHPHECLSFKLEKPTLECASRESEQQ